MRIIGLSLIFICCSLFGIWADTDQKKRIRELGSFMYLFELLKGEIDYQLTPLEEACRQIASMDRGNASKVFKTFATLLAERQGISVAQMWQLALESNRDLFHFKAEDYRMLESFGGCCGYLDKKMQTRNLEMVLQQLQREQHRSEEKYERCSKLTRSLGVLVGCVLVIFLI